ncbi:hypothetical protein Godav_009744, partial [Gossypium davidsonii]|nr:hypothetical protein [Gossypium davidsonii]
LERGLHGIEPVVVANFPTKTFCDECFSANKDAQLSSTLVRKCVEHEFPTKIFQQNEKPEQYRAKLFKCTVCLSEYRCEDVLRILPYCGHSFHVTCIDLWLQQHSTCPVCRISLRELPEKKRLMQPLFSSADRSHFGTESLNMHTYNCLLRGHGFPSRTRENPVMDPNQQNSFATGNLGSRENMSRTIEDDEDNIKEPRKKLVESASNP